MIDDVRFLNGAKTNIFFSQFMMANGILVRVLIHADVTKYLNFKAVDGSFVYNKGKVLLCRVSTVYLTFFLIHGTDLLYLE